MTNGAATTFTDIDISELVPPTSTIAYVNTNHVANTSQDFASFRPNGSSLDPVGHRTFAGDGSASTCFFIETDSSQILEYENSSGTEQTDLWVLGYVDLI